MMQKDKLIWVAMWMFGLLSVTKCSQKPTADSANDATAGKQLPNIIYVLVDDMGYGDLSSYGQQTLSTPNIDQLASEGIKLTNHYTGSTVCAPSRATLLTGLHTGHVSVRGNQPDQLLRDEDITTAEKLKEAGYYTGIIGKWGIGHPPPPNDPQRNGFDYSYGYINMWHAHNFYPEFLYRNGEKEIIEGNKLKRDENGKRMWAAESPEGAGVAEIKAQHTHEFFETDALKFIDNHKDAPFFLLFALNMPHANNEHPGNGMEVPDWGEFKDRDWPDAEKGFASMIKMIDETVGKLNDKLKSMNLDKHTLLIFSSDNGPHQEGFHQMEFFNSNRELRGMKRDFYDGGIKTPFIAKWPGHIIPGTTSDHISAFWDFMPTICEIVGAAPPDNTDGISMLPVLTGKSDKQGKHKYLYWEFYELGGRQAVLKGNFKAIKLNVRTGEPDPIQLFDLSVDPEEKNNVAGKHPDLVKEMAGYMEEAHTPLSFISLFKSEINADTPF